MIRDIENGNLMLVTDLHGNGYDYHQIFKVYNALKEQEKVDYLVFMGDLVHAYPGQKDESVAIVEDLIKRGANEADSDIICLLGNHEMVHIYHIPLAKGHLEFTSWFEKRIARKRNKIVNFFQCMPLAIRTAGGVLIHHTGAAEIYHPDHQFYQELFDWQNYSHYSCLKGIKDTQANLDPWGKYDPRVGSAFMDTREGEWLWTMLMNGNERQYGPVYASMIEKMLISLSTDRKDSPLNVLITGHIGVDYGVEVVAEKQLRLCSSAGCIGDLEKKFLLFPAEQKFDCAAKLMEYCKDLY